MKPYFYYLTGIAVGIALLVIYCEFLIYYAIQLNCDWPSLDPTKADPNISSNGEEPVKVMVIADTHLLGSTYGHWFDKLRREWQMHRAFQTAITLHQPELVFVLGDLLDEGYFCDEKEFQYYVKRFYDLFRVPESATMYVVVGNHDIGFHYRINPYLEVRFEQGFNSTPVRMVNVRGNHFVLINSMALEGDGCFLCKSAEQQLSKLEKILSCSLKQNPNCHHTQTLSKYSRPILMQHFPLFRESDKDCSDFDAAPYPEREELFREKMECLSKEATYQILKQIKPRLALSGHTHHGCTRNLSVVDGIEITIPSFSWRNKDNPNYVLSVFTADNYAVSKCQMPKESTVINLYMGGIVGVLLWLVLCSNIRRRMYSCYGPVYTRLNYRK